MVPGIKPGWSIKVSHTSFSIAWGVFRPIIQFPGRFFALYGILSFWQFLTQKYPFLDPPGHGMPPGWGIVTGQDFSQEIVKGWLWNLKFFLQLASPCPSVCTHIHAQTIVCTTHILLRECANYIIACLMDGGRGSHGFSAEDTKDKVKRPEPRLLVSW